MSWLPSTGIQGEGVLLRPVCRKDLELLRQFVNDPEVMQFSNVYMPINDYRQEQWFEQMSKSADSVWFAIADSRQEQEKVIGTCCLVGIDWVGRSAELRIRIGDKDAWGQGLGTQASCCLLGYSFGDLNLERIWLRVFASNERATRMYQKLGFQVEGRLRRAAVVGGVVEDVILMGLLREEWRGSQAV
jgi:RimJ/RimL family protein N-acetyltransferase